jgi:flavorubredoxin
MIKIVAENYIKEEYQEEFLKLTKELIILSREEKGNISYHLYQDINDDSHFTFIEEWQNQEAIDEHNHHLKFIMAPMVHWPEVMVEYETTEKVLFSADGFGKFGALSHDEDWACEARRYYFNIVGKYGAPVQTLLKKASTLDIKMICPLHGPILKDNLGYYIDKYQIWSSYQSEDEGVLVASASIHGNTKEVALKVVDLLKEKGVKVAFTDLTRDDMAEAVEDAFRYSKMILAGATYDGGVFSPMEDFLHRLQHKGYQNKTVGLIENGSWAPLANKVMKDMLTPMKNITICENTVTIKSTYKDENQEAINQLVEEICH